jgi:hypothetical protein
MISSSAAGSVQVTDLHSNDATNSTSEVLYQAS